MAASSDYIGAGDLSVDELRSALFGGSDRWSPHIALSLLGRKDYPQKEADLGRILAEGEGRLPMMAAHELGRLGTPDAGRMLIRALAHGEASLRRASALNLAASGSIEARSALHQFLGDTAGSEADRQAAAWSTQLLALRLGDALDQPIVAREESTLPVQDSDARPVEAEPFAEAEAKRVIGDLAQSPLHIDHATHAAQHLRCADRDFALVFTERANQTGLDRLGGESVILAVVADQDGVEVDEWSTRYLVVSDPRDDRTVDLVVITPDGRPVMVGRGDIDGAVAFHLRTVDQPGAVAVDCVGHINADGVRFDRFVSEQRISRRGRRAPLIPEEG